MTIQTVNLGTAPTGAGGDTFRSTGAKVNENFTNNTHAASRYVGTAAGNVMEVGVFGFGGAGSVVSDISTVTDARNALGNQSKIFRVDGGSVLQPYSPALHLKSSDTHVAVSFGALSGDV
ncbi:hypothetical protein RJC78_19470, partial [Acinetobacter baumannii]|nr:hypothetical protein [Acinetobacter baumannii]